jgi:anti-sigma regulatory factor (Ser/Thr protein kinase)
LRFPSKGDEHRIAAVMELSLAPTAAAPARARAAVTDWLGGHSRDDVLVEIALLLVSELVTNSIRHAQLEAETTLHLNASLGETTLRIELWDDGTGGTVARRAPRRDDDGGGYGLDLVERLSSGWGVDRDADGTTVWLELPVPFDETA